MMKRFHVDGICYPEEHYMVDMDDRLEEIKKLIEDGKYFVINRARQYGKTTILGMLAGKLSDEYQIFSISFEGLGDAAYENERAFCRRTCGLLYDTMYYGEAGAISDEIQKECYALSLEQEKPDLRTLSNLISRICRASDKPVILMIDEIDQASDQEIFLNFLGMLRDKYMKRKSRPTFRSVILAGVYDIKNLKLKMGRDGERQYNSPWNIAARFTVDMSFSAEDIAGMLMKYKTDQSFDIDVPSISRLIYDYTSGYPFLVSRICKILDEQIIPDHYAADPAAAWTKHGISEAVKILLGESNTLFDDMIKHLAEYPELNAMIQNILFQGTKYPYFQYSLPVSVGSMFGFLKEKDGFVSVSNRIFETSLYNFYISEEITKDARSRGILKDKNQFIKDGFLDMELVLQKFMESYTDIYWNTPETFLEDNGRRIFLIFLKPIINGTGNYYIEAQTRDGCRTDVIVDYKGKQYVIEMKLWHGDEYNRRGELQLAGYLDDYGLDKGYLLSFNFNKNKKTGMKEIRCNGKTILEVVV